MIICVDSGVWVLTSAEPFTSCIPLDDFLNFSVLVPSSAYGGHKDANFCLKSVLSYLTFLQCFSALGEGKKIEK